MKKFFYFLSTKNFGRWILRIFILLLLLAILGLRPIGALLEYTLFGQIPILILGILIGGGLILWGKSPTEKPEKPRH